MAMERALMRLMRASSSSGALLQRGAALSSLQAREYAASTSSALTSPSDGLSLMELRESIMAARKRRPIWSSSRGYAAHSSAENEDDANQGNVEYLEFGTHKKTAAKRFAVGTTAVDVDEEVEEEQVDEVTKGKAKEILQQVSEKMEETVEEAKIRQLQEKLAATEGIGEVVHDLYNQQEKE